MTGMRSRGRGAGVCVEGCVQKTVLTVEIAVGRLFVAGAKRLEGCWGGGQGLSAGLRVASRESLGDGACPDSGGVGVSKAFHAQPPEPLCAVVRRVLGAVAGLQGPRSPV